MKDAFRNNPAFLTAIKNAYEFFINEEANRPAELLAKFIDKKLQARTSICAI
jgi:cullin-4